MSIPPVPTPKYIFRGHASAIHALDFSPRNTHLVSGDSEGWIIVWDIVTKRAVSAWKAHDSGIVGIKHWISSDRLITHGRDHRLRVWDIKGQLEGDGRTNVKLPVDGEARGDQREPWILHSMSVYALNFCSFAICRESCASGAEAGILIAVPNGLDSGGIDVFQLPSERRVSQIRSDGNVNTGMVMAVCLFWLRGDTEEMAEGGLEGLCLIAGCEDGSVSVFSSERWITGGNWERMARYQPHSQPVLSLAVSEQGGFFVSSAADAVVAKFEIHVGSEDGKPEVTIEMNKELNTKHAGQQGIQIRSDGKLIVTAGWDARVRVYEARTMREVAVLKWHKEGCYCVAFTTVFDGEEEVVDDGNNGGRGRDVINGTALDAIKKQREIKASKTHWIAAGGKDGKISLWDIY